MERTSASTRTGRHGLARRGCVLALTRLGEDVVRATWRSGRSYPVEKSHAIEEGPMAAGDELLVGV